MDHIDRHLLGLLKRNSKMKYAEMGNEVHLSAPAVHERIKKLEKSGVIKNYSVHTDPKKLGLSLCAFISLSLSNVTLCSEAVMEIREIQEVEECFSTAGEESLLLKIRTVDTDSLEQLLIKLRAIPGVEKTLTRIVLTTHFERTSLLAEL
jgi:Lrp/AsnC family leucine-responsive transcriptional regulator